MNASIQDAIVVLRTHPRISNVQVTAEADGSCLLRAECDVQLPSTWKAIGHSPSGVKVREPVEIWFPKTFPNDVPHITLREDFRTDHPHLYIFKKGERIPPCLVHGDLREVLHTEGIERLIIQLFEWLERAAHNELIDKDFGWEPARRSQVMDWIYCDIESTAANAPALGGFQIFNLRVLQADTASSALMSAPFLKKRLDGNDAIRFAGSRVVHNKNNAVIVDTVATIFWPFVDSTGNVPFDLTFKPDSISTLGELIERADECGVGTLVRRFIENMANVFLLDASPPISQPLYLIFAIHRPFHILGYKTNIELLAYRIDWPVRRLQTEEVDALNIKPVAVLSKVTKDLLRRTSGLSPENDGIKTAILGCGSLGSKVAVHLSRAGYVPSIFIDSDQFAAHNSARHVLPPAAAFSPGMKAEQVAQLCVQFTSASVRHFPLPIEKVAQRDDARNSCLYDPSALLINTTGSNSVRRFLSGSQITSRVVEACALNLGRNAIMTLEGVERNPSTDDLMAFAYEKLRISESLLTQDGANQNPLRVGVGCNSVTLPMADALISMIAAGTSQALLRYQEHGLPSVGRLSLAKLENDDMSIGWSHWDLGRTQIADKSDTNGWTIRVLDSAHKKIVADVAANAGIETGGFIVGRISPVSREVIIVDILPAPPDSTRSPSLFTLGTQGRDDLIGQYDASGKGALWCLGTWHNHLQPMGPSPTDIRTAEILKGKLKRAAILLIHRPDGYSAIARASHDANWVSERGEI